MDKDALKKAAALAALDHIPEGSVVGVGTGSTVNHFIDGLADMRQRLAGAVSSSEQSAQRLRAHGIAVHNLNDVDHIPVYVDGADEINDDFAMIKGGGGALTREKIVAAVAERFICICDDSKCVSTLGRFPLPVEVIPMARQYVTRELTRLGGQPQLRAGFTTDNGNEILDVSGLSITHPKAFEAELDHIVGTVTNGLFARRGADLLLVATAAGIEHRTP